MSKMTWATCLGGALVCASAIQVCEAHVVRFQIEQRGPYLGGANWGATGSYELLRGTAWMTADPANPHDAVIVDIANAPRNADGLVEFSTPFLLLKPTDPRRANHKLFHAVNNRGNSLEGLLTATTPAQVAGTDAGYAMTQGYTIVDAGWEGDLVPTATNLGAKLPRARSQDGTPIVGPMRYEYSDRVTGSFTTNLEGTPGFLSYEAADTNTGAATFTVRDSEYGVKVPIAPDQWAFGSCPTGQASLVPGRLDLCYFSGFDNTKIYELIYQAKNPIVMGLGFAATRDVTSFLRYEVSDDAGNPNPLDGPTQRAYAAGGSQTGGFLRDYVYLGFNEDESGRKVFDGVIPWIAGTDRVFINVRFADPNVYSEQDRQHDFLQTSYPPFTYGVTTDPISGVHDGILKRPLTDPLVMQVDSESEFWQLHDSLNVATGLGEAIPIPPNVRLYFVGNTAHAFLGGSFLAPTPGSSTQCEYGTPASGIGWETLRSSLRNIDAWVDGTDPPASNYPSLLDGTLVTLAKARAAFPQIPGVAFPTVYDTYQMLDFGPHFDSLGGVITKQPPVSGASYAIFLPKTDANGIQLAGLHQIESRVPVGTSTGWNVRTPEHRGPALCTLTGSYFPFETTKDERIAAGDSRKSLQELYGNHDGFVAAVKKAATELVGDRFLLAPDARADVAAAQKFHPAP